jgi:hypothetical protein
MRGDVVRAVGCHIANRANDFEITAEAVRSSPNLLRLRDGRPLHLSLT